MKRLFKTKSAGGARTIQIIAAMMALGLLFLARPLQAVNDKSASTTKTTEKGRSAVQRIIFEEQKIEGKIRRPQLVLIKADQRPSFPPMLMQSIGKNDNVASFVDPSVVEDTTYQNPFQFQGTTIINYAP
jgi:hypothetical protein